MPLYCWQVQFSYRFLVTVWPVMMLNPRGLHVKSLLHANGDAGTCIGKCLREQAERRWCLSGTPIQNSIDDLYSYMRFLRYEPYARQSAFKTLIKEPLLQQPELGTQRLRAILKVCIPLTRHRLVRELKKRHACSC